MPTSHMTATKKRKHRTFSEWLNGFPTWRKAYASYLALVVGIPIALGMYFAKMGWDSEVAFTCLVALLSAYVLGDISATMHKRTRVTWRWLTILLVLLVLLPVVMNSWYR